VRIQKKYVYFFNTLLYHVALFYMFNFNSKEMGRLLGQTPFVDIKFVASGEDNLQSAKLTLDLLRDVFFQENLNIREECIRDCLKYFILKIRHRRETPFDSAKSFSSSIL
jgi:hypothetical protein